MKYVIASFVLALLCIEIQAQVDCTNLPDGVHGWGCKSYTVCRNGVGIVVECIGEQVFNEEKEACDDPENVGPPCGLWRNCTGQADMKYADLFMNCTAFYTCISGEFVGHNPCNPGTVFDEAQQVCDWPENVPPPCGTKEEIEEEEWRPKRGRRN